MNVINDIEENKSHYTELLKHSVDPIVCGSWGEEQSVDFRWKELAQGLITPQNSILEIGCGLGGFLDYLIKENLCEEKNYTGIDILPEMEKLNRTRHPNAHFFTKTYWKEIN